MNKARFYLIFITVILLNLGQSSQSLAIEDAGLKNKYPDYACEFTGKDPWESFNRKIFTFNLKANKYLIRPVNIVWASIMPQYGMDRIQSFYTNINYPVSLVGCLLQKDFKASKSETKRFLINSTLGIGGLYDPAQSKFKIEPREEDMEQALAHYKVKQGPYLVVPIVAQGNTRDVVGQALDVAFKPGFYLTGPLGYAAGGLYALNWSVYMQPVFKLADNYPDPYVISKQASGVERYIKNANFDRQDVFSEKIASQNIVPIANVPPNPNLKADIQLNNFNSQSPEIDSIRSMWFDKLASKDPTWSELSVWNRCFDKKLKTSSVSIAPKHPNYKYRYLLQKDKSAPLAIIYASLGEGITATQSMVQAQILYGEGYSVLITSNPFNWEFIKSMWGNYKPALPPQDALTLRQITPKIIDDIQRKNSCKFNKKIIVGNSYGAITTLFVAAQEEENNTLGISKYISINPPIDYLYALKQIDKYAQDLQNTPGDVKLRAAMTAQKAIQVSQDPSIEKLPFTEDEAKLAVGYSMKQKLSDVIFAVENGPKLKSVEEKRELYKKISTMGYYDYALKYFVVDQDKTLEQFDYDASLYSVSKFLKENKKYKLYHTLDDFLVNPQQLIWLKKQSGDKAVYFSNGSHFGYLYRQEFLDEFKKDIKIEEDIPASGL